MFNVAEPASPKPGHGCLKLLEAVSNVIDDEGIVPEGVGAMAYCYFGESQYQYFYKHNNCMQVTARDNLH